MGVAYAIACRDNITVEFIERLKKAESRTAEAANSGDRIFTAPIGGEQIFWGWKHGALFPVSLQDIGWREGSDGTREEVVYYGGEWGWMSLTECHDARQKYPHTAP